MPLETLQNGRYRILRPLGSGSMGEVYLVEDTRINRQVAIKVIRSETTPYPADSTATMDAARLFEREAKAIAMLNHPNILPLYDFGEEVVNGNPLTYMVMPYSPEGSLATWLQQHGITNPLSLQDIAHFLRQAADALQHAHDNGMIHQDVKPQNFLIRSNKNASLPDLLLADFGIAKLAAGTSGASQAIRGTPIYMAPEQWEGHPVPASDQYSLAVMIYQILSGQPPFKGGPGQMMYQHFNTVPQPPSAFNPAVGPDLDAVVLRALAKRPEERFASVSAFASAFQQALVLEASTISSTQNKARDESIRATLAISPEEAIYGTSRMLTLTGGRRVTVAIPPGAQTGHVIRTAVEDSSGEGTTIPLLLTIAIAHTGENLPTVITGDDQTFSTGLPTVDSNSGRISKSGLPASIPDSGRITLSDHPTMLSNSASTPILPPRYDTPTSRVDSTATPPDMLPARRPPRRGMTILLIALALLLIVGSAGAIFYYFSTSSSNGPNTGATATALANNDTATSQSNGTGTALANSNSATATAQINATAQSKANATATANAQANATATAITLGNIHANATATAQASASVVPFSVQSVTVAVDPTSIAGDACGSTITVTYTATFTVSSNSPGGTVQFTYTTDNGQSSKNDSIAFTAGETTKTYSFTWTGALPADHTAPGIGKVITSSPNSVTSNGAQPSGQCVSPTPTPT